MAANFVVRPGTLNWTSTPVPGVFQFHYRLNISPLLLDNVEITFKDLIMEIKLNIELNQEAHDEQTHVIKTVPLKNHANENYIRGSIKRQLLDGNVLLVEGTVVDTLPTSDRTSARMPNQKKIPCNTKQGVLKSRAGGPLSPYGTWYAEYFYSICRAQNPDMKLAEIAAKGHQVWDNLAMEEKAIWEQKSEMSKKTWESEHGGK